MMLSFFSSQDECSLTVFNVTPANSNLVIQQQHTNSVSSKPCVSCGNCEASPRANSPPFNSCGACKQISYCCKECQTVDWPRHKLKYKTDRDNQTKPAPSLEIDHNNSSSSTRFSDADYLKNIQKLISRADDLNKQLDNDKNTILLMATSNVYHYYYSMEPILILLIKIMQHHYT